MIDITAISPNLTTTEIISPDSNGTGTQVVSGLCGVCPAGCGVNITLINGRISRIVPKKERPLRLNHSPGDDFFQKGDSPAGLSGHPFARNPPLRDGAKEYGNDEE